MTGAAAVDVHVHLAPVLDDPAAAGVESRDGRLVVDAHAVGPPDLYRPDHLLAYLDSAGIDLALVAAPPPFYRQGLAAHAAGAWVTAANDGIVAACADEPERLRALAYLPWEHPALAAEVVAAEVAAGRTAGFSAAAGGGSPALDDPELAGVWAALDRAGALLVLHPSQSPDARLAAHYGHNLTGNPVETAVAVSALVFGGVLDRHPRVRIVLVHGGGVVPALAGRWHHGVATSRPGLPDPPVDVAASLARLWTDCLTDPAMVDVAATVFGEDHLLLGSDWPFPMGTRDPVGRVRHRGPAAVDVISRRNPLALLGA